MQVSHEKELNLVTENTRALYERSPVYNTPTNFDGILCFTNVALSIRVNGFLIEICWIQNFYIETTHRRHTLKNVLAKTENPSTSFI